MTPAEVPAQGEHSRAGQSNTLFQVGALRRSDVGILPLLFCFPLMYYPKVLEGDTQPWVLIGALIALFTFRTSRFLYREDIPIVALAFLCAMVFAIRSESSIDSVRAAYTQVTFIILWLVVGRENGDFFPGAVRMTVTIWFAVGLYQYISVAVGHPVEIVGRFVEGRSGIPSLASEPSAYGSLSMIQMMYLLAENKPRNRPYLILASASVVLSGSLLAMCLFVFPLMKLKMRLRIVLLLLIPLLVSADYFFTSAGLTSRLTDVVARSSLAAVFLDPSLNLRLGHIYFTLVHNLIPSLLFQSQVDFMSQYNNFAATSVVFIDTGSNFILTSAGELIYGSGFIGAILLFIFIRKSRQQASTRLKKLEKFVFITACMLNPIPMSNVFLVIYAKRRT